MCGIFGYIGKKDGVSISLKGLKKLEYRGYDSAGLAGIGRGKLFLFKEVGKISQLEESIRLHPVELPIVIAQTRWATHGKPSVENCHPHFDAGMTVAVVHNGIIENYEILKASLKKEGVTFHSETDTEVIPHLIAKHYKGDLLAAVQTVVPLLEGAFALAIIHRNHPDQIIAVAKESPLAIGLGNGETFIASDAHALAPFTTDVVYLSHGEVACVKADQLTSLMPPSPPSKKSLTLFPLWD